MSAREAFGPNLRRLRIQQGVSLEHIAEVTKVSVSLWAGLERNDFSRWPNGIYARSYVRVYAAAIGADADATVDEFCRWFPQGDRRVGPTVREHAEIVGHALNWRDEIPPTVEGDRRGSSSTPPARPARTISAFAQMFVRLRRSIDRA
jgi:transcriptional regulator with XRE-family HTH domain